MLTADLTDNQLAHYRHHFLFYYINRTDAHDPLSLSFLLFKKNKERLVSAWTDCAVTALKGLHLDENTIILRALHSHETQVKAGAASPLDTLCLAIASTYHSLYVPGNIFKKRATQPLHQMRSVNDRIAETRDVYHASLYLGKYRDKSILLVDDLVTTGLTISKIIQAIRTILPDNLITIFSLAKTGYNPDINANLRLQGKSYAWKDIKWIELGQ